MVQTFEISIKMINVFYRLIMFPNSIAFFHTTIEFSHPCSARRGRSLWNRMPIDQSGKNLLEKAASCDAAAAKRSPLFCQSATGKIRAALSPGALYPPSMQTDVSPYDQLVVEYVPAVTAAEPRIYHPRQPSYQNHPF